MSDIRFSRRGAICRRAVLSAALCLLLFTAIPFIPVPRAYAAEVPVSSADAAGNVSGTDVSFSDVIDDDHFKRVGMIPLNVDIPYFYDEVANISGMYIFTLPDGTVYKRIYGALDDIYGWYEPQGFDNKIPPGSEPIDTAEDTEMYEEALEAAGIIKQYTSDYYGILPPEQGTSAVNALFGKPAMFIFIICGAVTALLCVIILISSASKKRPAQSAADKIPDANKLPPPRR